MYRRGEQSMRVLADGQRNAVDCGEVAIVGGNSLETDVEPGCLQPFRPTSTSNRRSTLVSTHLYVTSSGASLCRI